MQKGDLNPLKQQNILSNKRRHLWIANIGFQIPVVTCFLINFRLEIVLHANFSQVCVCTASRVVPNCPFPSTFPRVYF
jgi:hypothetical protein